jgi:hypothetical protein
MADETTTLRKCIGSARFGIEPHEAPVEDFPRQPSQKDGLGRMCKVHWNQYTAGLARDAKARKAAASAEVMVEPADQAPEPSEPIASDAADPPGADSPTDAGSPMPEQPAPKRKRPRPAVVPSAGSQGDAG